MVQYKECVFHSYDDSTSNIRHYKPLHMQNTNNSNNIYTQFNYKKQILFAEHNTLF